MLIMRKRRRFYDGKMNHVYQRTEGWVNIFYCNADYLVYYTIFAVCAKAAKIQVLMLCLMYDHTHSLARAENIRELSAFIDRSASWFVKEYNHQVGRKGKLLHKNFGSAPKWSDKDVRSAINYVGNNPVEKGLCSKAEEYRWNFLAYAVSDHPFSDKYVPREASKHLRSAIKEAKEMADQNLPLKYVHLKRMMKKLSCKELEQFIDQVIIMYLPFDFNKAISYFGSYEAMIDAMHHNTGSEHDIKEHNDRASHIVFKDVLAYLGDTMPSNEIRKITVLSESDKCQLARKIRSLFPIGEWQICKFLHMSSEKVGSNGGA